MDVWVIVSRRSTDAQLKQIWGHRVRYAEPDADEYLRSCDEEFQREFVVRKATLTMETATGRKMFRLHPKQVRLLREARRGE